MQNPKGEIHQVQQSPQIGELLTICLVLQGKWEDKPPKTRNEERGTMSTLFQVYKLLRQSSGWL